MKFSRWLVKLHNCVNELKKLKRDLMSKENKWFKKFMGVPLEKQTDVRRWCEILGWIAGTTILFIVVAILV